MQEALDAGEIDQPPMVEICLLPDGMEGNTCAAFIQDEDGYEICLRDEMSGRIRCSSSYSTKEDRPEASEPHRSRRSGMFGI